MILTAISTFLSTKSGVWGAFSPIHLLSVVVIVSCALAIWQVRRGNIRAHKSALISAYIGGIFGAGAFHILAGPADEPDRFWVAPSVLMRILFGIRSWQPVLWLRLDMPVRCMLRVSGPRAACPECATFRKCLTENHVLIVHYLNNSRAHRLIWLLEELGLDYEIKFYRRGPDYRAPAELKKVHPLASRRFWKTTVW